MASIAVGALGAGLGFLAGGPAGARLGWAVGTVVGGLLFPARQESQSGHLDDRRITGSSLGVPIPQIFGTMRTGGNIIWALDLIEKKKTSGGKSNRVTKYTYFATFAVLLCAGPVTAVTKIYAPDGTIIYNSSATPQTKENITPYLGTTTQPQDGTIVADKGAANTPAYRGYCYVVIKNMDVTKYGNQIPQLSFEVQQSASATVGSVINSFATQVGLVAGDMDLSAGTASVPGYILTNRTDCKSAIEPLLRAYPSDIIEVDGQLKIVSRGAAAVATVLQSELGASTGQPMVTRMEIRRAQEIEQPTIVDVVYYCPGKQYQQATQRAQRQTKPHLQDALTVTYPGALTDDQARQMAERILYTASREREQYQLKLPPSYLYTCPSDCLIVPTNTGNKRLRLDHWDSAMPGEISCTGVLDEAAVLTQVVSGAVQTTTSPSVLAPVSTTFLAFSGVELQPTDGFYTGFYVAAGPVGGVSGWAGCTVYYSADGGTNWIACGDVLSESAIGTSVGALANYTGANPDTTNTVNVTITTGTLGPASASEVAAGLNQAILGNEVLGFTGASIVSAGLYTLSGLTRKEVSTLATGHAAGERFAQVGSATARFQVPDALAGTTILVKCVAPYETLAGVTAQSVLLATKSGGPGATAVLPGGTPTLEVGATSSAGAATTYLRSDAQLRGVHSLSLPSGTLLYGDVVIAAGTNVTLAQSGQTITINSSAAGGTSAFLPFLSGNSGGGSLPHAGVVVHTDGTYVVDAGGANLQLESSSLWTVGQAFAVVNNGSAIVDIAPNGNYIAGDNTTHLILQPGESVILEPLFYTGSTARFAILSRSRLKQQDTIYLSAARDGKGKNTAGTAFSTFDPSTLNAVLVGDGIKMPEAGDNSVYFGIPLPRNMAATPNLSVRLYLMSAININTSEFAGADQQFFNVSACCMTNSLITSAAFSTAVGGSIASTGNVTKTLDVTPSIPGSYFPAAGGWLYVRVQRNGADASDTSARDVILMGVDIKFDVI